MGGWWGTYTHAYILVQEKYNPTSSNEDSWLRQCRKASIVTGTYCTASDKLYFTDDTNNEDV